MPVSEAAGLDTLKDPKDPEMGVLEIVPDDSQTCSQLLHETFVEDKWFWLIIVVMLIANIGIYQYLFLG
jgi:hypothetical protein